MLRTALLVALFACQCDPQTSDAPDAPDVPTAPAPAAPTAPSIERIGAGPAPPAADWEVDKGACAHRIRLRELAHVSDSALSADGMGKATPLVLSEDGAPMKGFAKPDDYRARCTGSFAFPKNYLVFSPSDAAGADAHSYALSLSQDAPMQAPGGPIYWVYPGTSLALSFPSGGDALVQVSARFYGEGVGAATLVAGDQSVPLERKGRSVKASLTTDQTRVEIRSPADGPWLIVTSALVGEGAGALAMIGEAGGAEPAGASATLLGGPKKNPPTYAGAPGPIDTPEGLEASKNNSARMVLMRFRDMADNVLKQELQAANCSPLRLLESGTPLPTPNARCTDVREKGEGRYCHSGESLVFSAPDGSNPLENGRRYGLALSRERACAGNWWVYPGDTMTTTPIEPALRKLARGGDRLTIKGRALGPGDRDAQIAVRLLAGGEAVLSESTPLSALAEGVAWDLPAALPARALDVRLEVSAPDTAAFLLLTDAALAERGD